MRNLILSALFLCAIAISPAAHAQEKSAPERPEGLNVLDRLVGAWSSDATEKPTKALPDGAKRQSTEVTEWILKKHFILARDVVPSNAVKSLWLMTYDPKSNSYPFWYFNSKGVPGGEWSNTWDEKTTTLTGKATDTPKGWTSHSTQHFLDKNTNQAAFWMKDDTGTALFDVEAKKTRQGDDAGAKTLAAWSNPDKNDLPPELKVMERLVGNWDATGVSKPAEWTPKEVRTTSKVKRQWVLDGRFLQDTTEASDGNEAFSLMTYDPQMKAYRSWWFGSEGFWNKSSGTWDEKANTASFKADLGDGLTAASELRIIDNDHHVWKVIIKDGGGKVFLDAEVTVKRRKE